MKWRMEIRETKRGHSLWCIRYLLLHFKLSLLYIQCFPSIQIYFKIKANVWCNSSETNYRWCHYKSFHSFYLIHCLLNRARKVVPKMHLTNTIIPFYRQNHVAYNFLILLTKFFRFFAILWVTWSSFCASQLFS